MTATAEERKTLRTDIASLENYFFYYLNLRTEDDILTYLFVKGMSAVARRIEQKRATVSERSHG